MRCKIVIPIGWSDRCEIILPLDWTTSLRKSPHWARGHDQDDNCCDHPLRPSWHVKTPWSGWFTWEHCSPERRYAASYMNVRYWCNIPHAISSSSQRRGGDTA